MPKNFFQSSCFYLALLIILTIPLCFSLFSGQLIQGHDALGALIRECSMEKYFGNGQFIIRWSPDVNFGYGSPILNFYPPFFYYVAYLFSHLTQNTILAMNLTCLVFWVLSGVGMYIFAREFWGNTGAFLSALSYIYIPYHVQEYYVRGAFSELSAFTIFPFLLFSIHKLNQKFQIRYLTAGILSACLSSLTHGMGTFFIIIAFVYSVFLYSLNKNRGALVFSVSALLIGFMMAAFYWLPAIIETKFTNLNFIIDMRYNFHKNFISIWQVLSMPWESKKSSDGLSFQIGAVQLILLCFSFLIPFKFFIKNPVLVKNYLFFLVVGMIAVFLTLPISVLLWEHINTLKFMQLPWRFLTIANFTVSFLIGSSILLFKKDNLRFAFLSFFAFLIILLPINYYGFAKYQYIGQQAFKNHFELFSEIGEGEPTPMWINVPPLLSPPMKFEVVKGGGAFSSLILKNPVDYRVNFLANQDSLLCFHSFYFPGWKVFIDGIETQINHDNIWGVILFICPSGNHTIRVVFGLTPIRFAATAISWAGVFLLMLIGFYGSTIRKFAKNQD